MTLQVNLNAKTGLTRFRNLKNQAQTHTYKNLGSFLLCLCIKIKTNEHYFELVFSQYLVLWVRLASFSSASKNYTGTRSDF